MTTNAWNTKIQVMKSVNIHNAILQFLIALNDFLIGVAHTRTCKNNTARNSCA